MDGEVAQHVEYFPFGETFLEEHSNTDRTPYLFNGKELDEETQLYYYGARYYDARTSVWQSVDPLAEDSEQINKSPYAFTWNNPIRYVDPTGLKPLDDYGLDKQGNITLLRKTDDTTDKLIALDNDGNETDKSTEIDKGILSSKKTNTITGSNGRDYTFDQYKIKGDDKADNLFEFVANNTEVEWSLTGIGAENGAQGNNILTTSHIENSEIGGGYLLAYGYTIRFSNHSHPYSNNASRADRAFAKALNQKFPNARTRILHNGSYTLYDEKGSIKPISIKPAPIVIINPFKN